MSFSNLVYKVSFNVDECIFKVNFNELISVNSASKKKVSQIYSKYFLSILFFKLLGKKITLFLYIITKHYT